MAAVPSCFPVVRGSLKLCRNQLLLTQRRCRVATASSKAKRQLQPEVAYEAADPNPGGHTADNLCQFYPVTNDVVESVLVHCFTKKFQQQCHLLGDASLMIRKPAIEVITQLRNPTQDAPAPKFVFYGSSGSGKSLSLAHVIHYCITAGWFVLHVPSVFSWVHSKGSVHISPDHGDRFDQPEEAAHWLQMIRTINGTFLSQMKTSQRYTWGKRDATEEGESLVKVVDQGLRRTNFASDAVGVLLKEIKLDPSIRVLYAVDEFNGLFGKTSFKDAKQKWIKPANLSLVHHFTRLLNPDTGLKHGAMVFALSRTGMQRSRANSDEVEELLGEQGDAMLHPFTKILVPTYSDKELNACLGFYTSRGFLAREPTKKLVEEISFLTARQPRLVSSVCGRL